MAVVEDNCSSGCCNAESCKSTELFLRAEIPENMMECLVGVLCTAMYAPGEQVRTTQPSEDWLYDVAYESWQTMLVCFGEVSICSSTPIRAAGVIARPVVVNGPDGRFHAFEGIVLSNGRTVVSLYRHDSLFGQSIHSPYAGIAFLIS